jgi:hypothetical protein
MDAELYFVCPSGYRIGTKLAPFKRFSGVVNTLLHGVPESFPVAVPVSAELGNDTLTEACIRLVETHDSWTRMNKPWELLMPLHDSCITKSCPEEKGWVPEYALEFVRSKSEAELQFCADVFNTLQIMLYVPAPFFILKFK